MKAMGDLTNILNWSRNLILYLFYIVFFAINIIFIILIDMTAQLEHSQCHLVETDSTTSLHISLCSIMSMLYLTSKSMEKPSVQLLVKRNPQHLVIQFTHHAVWQLMLQKVKS